MRQTHHLPIDPRQELLHCPKSALALCDKLLAFIFCTRPGFKRCLLILEERHQVGSVLVERGGPKSPRGGILQAVLRDMLE
jgi:hypothetical protein